MIFRNRDLSAAYTCVFSHTPSRIPDTVPHRQVPKRMPVPRTIPDPLICTGDISRPQVIGGP